MASSAPLISPATFRMETRSGSLYSSARFNSFRPGRGPHRRRTFRAHADSFHPRMRRRSCRHRRIPGLRMVFLPESGVPSPKKKDRVLPCSVLPFVPGQRNTFLLFPAAMVPAFYRRPERPLPPPDAQIPCKLRQDNRVPALCTHPMSGRCPNLSCFTA